MPQPKISSQPVPFVILLSVSVSHPHHTSTSALGSVKGKKEGQKGRKEGTKRRNKERKEERTKKVGEKDKR